MSSILGRIFRGSGEPMDGGPDLSGDPPVPVGGPTVNPVMRVMPTKMIETRVPMIDLFNCLFECQKIPIFSVGGEPHSELLARIGFQADADVLVFGGLGLVFDDFHFFRTAFEEHGVFARTVMFVNQASDDLACRHVEPHQDMHLLEAAGSYCSHAEEIGSPQCRGMARAAAYDSSAGFVGRPRQSAFDMGHQAMGTRAVVLPGGGR